MRKQALLLFLGAFLVLASIPAVKSDSTPVLMISAPRCTLTGDIPLSANIDRVQVNVTTTYPISNALFYYEFIPFNHSGPPPVLNFNQYNTSATSIPSTNGTFLLSFPIANPENNTVAFGFVRVNDSQGNVAYSNEQPYPYPTCAFSSAAQKASLDMDVSVLDINPRYLNMSVNVMAAVYNSITFAPVTLYNEYTTPSFLQVNQSESSGYYLYYSARTNESVLPYGLMQLFPFDSYTYYMQFQCQCNLAFGSMSVNNIPLVADRSAQNVLNYSITGSVGERIDQNAWILNSSALFTPAKGNQPASLTITIHISRNPNEVIYPIIVPLLALYGILSISILATRKGDLGNRLLIYISIFIFSYGFLNYISSLIVSPLTTGASMVNLLTYALIPCTAVLAAFSFIRWIPSVRTHRTAPDIVDFVGMLLAISALLIVTTFSLKEYEVVNGVFKLVPVQYGLFSLGWFGKALLVLFASGLSYPIARIILRWSRVTDYLLTRRLRHNSSR